MGPEPAYVPEYQVPSTPSKVYTNTEWDAAMNRGIKKETEEHNLPTSLNRILVIPVTESMIKHKMNVMLSKTPIQYISEGSAKYATYTIDLRGTYPILRSKVSDRNINGEFSVEDGTLRFIDKRTSKPLYQRTYYVYTFPEGGRRGSTHRRLRKKKTRRSRR